MHVHTCLITLIQEGNNKQVPKNSGSGSSTLESFIPRVMSSHTSALEQCLPFTWEARQSRLLVCKLHLHLGHFLSLYSPGPGEDPSGKAGERPLPGTLPTPPCVGLCCNRVLPKVTGPQPCGPPAGRCREEDTQMLLWWTALRQRQDCPVRRLLELTQGYTVSRVKASSDHQPGNRTSTDG